MHYRTFCHYFLKKIYNLTVSIAVYFNRTHTIDFRISGFQVNMVKFAFSILMRNYFFHIKLLIFKLCIIVFLYGICRGLFFIFNLDTFGGNSFTEVLIIFFFGIRFDLTSIIIINSLFIVLYIVPFQWINNSSYKKTIDIFFLTANLLIISLNLIDIEYFKYTNKRSTADLFSFVAMSDDVVTLIPQLIKDFWYLFICWAGMIYTGIFLLKMIRQKAQTSFSKKISDRLLSVFVFILFLGLLVFVVRGGRIKPLRIISAIRFTESKNTPLIINTPFSIIHTFGTSGISETKYFRDSELDKIFSPERQYHHEKAFKKENIVLIILESFSSEYIDFSNDNKGYTPFLDKIISKGLVFKNAFANATSSIESLPAILAGLPALMNTAYISSEYSGNKLKAFPSILADNGYNTSFFHGGRNGTMGFDDFVKLSGINDYYGLNEYEGPEAYDGNWGIYDIEFLDFTAQKLESFQEPFFTCIYTLTSHHPYKIPEKYEKIFNSGEMPVHNSIMYADFALKLFFEKISKMQWYDNTLFVLVTDHTGAKAKEYYRTYAGIYRIPVIYYHPSDSTITGVSHRITQQCDIMPSILDYLNYNGKFTSFGNSVFRYQDEPFCINYHNNLYMLIKDEHLLSFDGENSIGLFNLTQDSLLHDNIVKNSELTKDMETNIKAVIQSYNHRMLYNKLTIE